MRELIKQYPELGDVLAEVGNRLSFLENSLPYNTNVISDTPKNEQVLHTMSGVPYEAFDKLKGQVNYLTNKITEIRAEKATTKPRKYKFFSNKDISNNRGGEGGLKG